MNTNARIKSIETYLTTTEDKPKSTDDDLKTTFSQLEPNLMNNRHFSRNSDHAEIKHEAVVSNVKKATHLSDRKGIFDDRESKLVRSQIGEI